MTTQVIKQATKRQLWYLHVLTGQDTRQLDCTALEADQMIKQAIADKTGTIELTAGMLCPNCDEVRNHGAKFCYLCGSKLLSEENAEAKSNRHEEKIGLKDYLNNEPVATFRARGMSLTSLCGKGGRMPEAFMPQQAAKLVGHRIHDVNFNKNHRVPREHCLDIEGNSCFGGRFETSDDLIDEIEKVAKVKRRMKKL